MIQSLLIVLRGVAMGAADVVPGVSGGTIAFITGIYQKLLSSIKSINAKALQILFKQGIAAFWQHINGTFLLLLGSGIIISVFSLAKVLEFLLTNYAILIWSFFFGLIIASAIYVGKQIKTWSFPVVLSLIAGVVLAFFITTVSPAQTSESYWFVFLSGAIAICAMILPGISGSFILLLLGKYQFILQAVNDLKIMVLAVFMLGAGTGLLAFSNILSWLLKKFHYQTIALLSGFMIGSLNKVWPWKETIETTIDRHGEEIPLVQKNILPDTYTTITGEPNYLLYGVLLLICGFLLIFGIEFLANKLSKK